MKIGYVCDVREQKSDPTSRIVMALKEAGCQTIFSDLLDFEKGEQLNLALALEYARAGDTLVVWDISAFSSDTQNFANIMQMLQQRDIGLQILAENFSEIKPHSWESQVMLESYSVLANLERRLK
ncbi:site-specific recombinase, DNA invertase Pin [Xenococcus sp. PCC 7305]|uniref:recombinase family protein n=1 Tax=Xenococcus sp. PCC 7305 TaxID=102125 RepID=UPI0002AC6B0E|nr:recombinase family protein [Xenococcus sp. PCC 7305]ELS02693.1 site-specific recombinase, DNA invertase Pin [Xenococcus sp. PCC 7305]